jgi:hypothetical protein
MPNYGTLTPITSLHPGDSLVLFNAESPAALQSSIAFSRGYNPGGGETSPITFTASWDVAPTAVLNIQGANTDAEGQYVTLGTITASPGYYADLGGFQFYRVQLASQSAGGAVTVKAQR